MKRETKKKLLTETLPGIGGIVLVLSYIPQIWMIYTTKNVEGQSLMFWLMLSFSVATYVGNQYAFIQYEGVKEKTGFWVQVINLIGALAVLVGVLLYR